MKKGETLLEIQDLHIYFIKGGGVLSKLFGKGKRIVHAVMGLVLISTQQRRLA